ncbi:MAG TPA: pyridoxamine 5'-phosphate oxidase [Ignavibacteriales bacterium]|nr:pyridoxamine 5'-phosphate oxidase [Ignavibacteriales bacterium]
MPLGDLAAIRKDYILRSLDEKDVDADPVRQFQSWLNDAMNAAALEPTAMALATSSKDGTPSARIVLLKGVDAGGLYFFTNYLSGKGKALEENPKAAAVFFWAELERQTRIEGIVEKLSAEESEAYFNSRPEESRISAAISPQSRIVPDRKYLEDMFAARKLELNGSSVKRPPHWGGYKIIPNMFEFWQGRANRLHDRIRYVKDNAAWKIERLAP